MTICSPRWATTRTPSRETLGDAATRIAAALGTPFMPWQKQVADVALEVNPETGRFAFRDVVLTVPRQSGKTTLLLVLTLLRALAEPRQRIRYAAQTGADARKKMVDDWLPLLQRSEFSKLFHPRMASGHETLRFNNGSMVGLLASTLKAGHGTSLDLAILDEAFSQPDARAEQALRPAMMTRPQPQFWIVSTAGTPDASAYLLEKVESGRQLAEAGITEGVAYFEWSAEDDADPGEPETWRSCMPALGLTVTEDAVAADFASMDTSEFKRAYCNQWVVSVAGPVISLDTWNALIDPRSTAQDPIAMAFDVTPDRSRSAIAVAGQRSDGLAHAEIIDHQAGTNWLPERLAQLVKKHRPSGVYCDGSGPAGSLLGDLNRLRVDVTPVSVREHGQACGVFYDAATDGTMRHLGSVELVAALDGAVRRPLGDAWAWSRKSSTVDISPLVAVTLALWGNAQRPRRRRGGLIDLNAVIADGAHGRGETPFT